MSEIKNLTLRSGWSVFASAMGHGEPFRASNLRGTSGSVSDSFGGCGRLYTCRCGFGELYRASAAADGVAYTVRSFHTPIAFRSVSGEWHMDKCHYSNRTTRHQNLISAAIDRAL
jgi:hypothetical protein